MKLTPRSFAALMALCLGAVLLVGPPPSSAAPGHGHGHDKKCDKVTSVNKLLPCVTLEGVMEHQWALQKIADANDGNRASGTSGYDASADYVERRLAQAPATRCPAEFEYFSFEEIGPSVLRRPPRRRRPTSRTPTSPSTAHSEQGDVTAAVTAGRHPARLATDPPAAARPPTSPGSRRATSRSPARHVHVRDQGQQRRRRGSCRHRCSSTRATPLPPTGTTSRPSPSATATPAASPRSTRPTCSERRSPGPTACGCGCSRTSAARTARPRT